LREGPSRFVSTHGEKCGKVRHLEEKSKKRDQNIRLREARKNKNLEKSFARLGIRETKKRMEEREEEVPQKKWPIRG